MATKALLDWNRIWVDRFAPRFTGPMDIALLHPIPSELVVPAYVWMRRDPAWTAKRVGMRLGLHPFTPPAIEAQLAQRYLEYVVPEWQSGEGGGWR